LEFLGTALRAGGLLITEKDIERIKPDIDPQNRGVIELGTFFITMARLKRDAESVDGAVVTAFEKISKDFLVKGEKKIAPSILRSVLFARGGDVLTEKELDDFAKKIDAISDKKDGTIDLDDLKDVILNNVSIDVVRVRVHERALKEEQRKSMRASQRASRRKSGRSRSSVAS
jgi:Ca2+-binding EF-hand superfamily protein